MPKILTELNNEDLSSIKNIKYIFSDMDGTLTEDAVFSDKLFTAIGQLKSKGIGLYIITGRSAGWVAALAEYLPVNGIIAENGAILFRKVNGILKSEYLINLPSNIAEHRDELRKIFLKCRNKIPRLMEAMDNMFRLADFSIDLGDLTLQEIHIVRDTVQNEGFDFTYSNVQIHIMPKGLNKADGIKNAWIKLYGDSFDSKKILTIGDSLNDEAMFNSNIFYNTAAVSNVNQYLDKMQHKPKFICSREEINGFIEFISLL
jgi:HAD superfamily hydrolase (TIGR01484 family)